MRILYALVVLATLVAPAALAAMPDAIVGKAPVEVVARIAAGEAQDLIVHFDERATLKAAEALQRSTGRPSSHRDVVAFRAAGFRAQKQAVLAGLGDRDVTVLIDYSHLPLAFLRVRTADALARLAADPRVLQVYEDRREPRALAESLPLIGQPHAAAQGYLGAGATVAVIDSGVDYTHPAFGSCTAPGVPASCKVAYARDFAPYGGKRAADPHGTNVAGIVLGVAPTARVVALDVIGADKLAALSDQLAAMNWVVANQAAYGIVAMNMSIGGGKYGAPVSGDARKPAVDQARAAGVLTVAAAGNNGYAGALSVPAAIAGVISVGAVYDSAQAQSWTYKSAACTDYAPPADHVACFSNSAPFLTLLAPGAFITAAGVTTQGTSQASPHVAGAVAVLRAAFPGETLEQTVARLAHGTPVTDAKNDVTKPRLDLAQALGIGAPCAYATSVARAAHGAAAATGTVAVTAGAGCGWTAASPAAWITVTTGATGAGDGTVTYAVAANANAAPRTSVLTVAGTSITVEQAGAADTSANVLQNPDFENGPVAWDEASSGGYPIVTPYETPTAAGDHWYAWLCGYDDCVERLGQNVTIPADAADAFVRFRYLVATDEKEAHAFDTMAVRLYSPPGAASFVVLTTISNLDAAGAWTQSAKLDVGAWKGRPVRLEFVATTDADLPTDFFVDDVTLVVSGSALADTAAPTVPTGVTAAASGTTQADVRWKAATDAVGVTAYRIYRNGTLAATVGTATAAVVTGLVPGATYSFTVAACDGVGNCSARSAPATLAMPALADTQPPSVPTGLAAVAVNGNRVDLSWNAATDNVAVAGYRIFLAGSLVATVGNVTASTRSVGAGQTYRYTVAACDAAGNCSAQSAAAVVTTPGAPDTQPPAVPAGLRATVVGPTRIDLAWNAATDDVGVTGYRLYAAGSLVATLGNVTGTSRTNRPLTTYSYTVAACDAAGNCSAQSAAAVATTPALTRVQAIEYYHAAFDHYFVTAIADEVRKLDDGTFAGWARTGQAFAVYAESTAENADVCRFFSTQFAPKSSHFYTPDANECATLRNGPWSFEGIVFGVPLPDANGSCPAGTAPVYRVYNNGQGGAPNHRYTTSAATRGEMLGKGWIAEGYGVGVVMCSPQ